MSTMTRTTEMHARIIQEFILSSFTGNPALFKNNNKKKLTIIKLKLKNMGKIYLETLGLNFKLFHISDHCPPSLLENFSL